ncbi:MAG: alkaline phosphatase D family protein [Phycisphaerae bacterium]|nr:alkaline phosphatase D family protein [Gemmatimonadaceae bacterium]
MDRRNFLADMTRAAALCAVVPNVWRVRSRVSFADDPFSLGVASGDITSTGGVLWTRLAPRPLEPEGGMPGPRTTVTWEVADDDSFRKIVKTGRATASHELSYSVHVDVDGLEPNRWYWYRFSTAGATGATSPTGRLRTAPADGVMTPLSFAFASCQQFEEGHFTALDHLSREDVDLVAFLGDYIYEYGPASGNSVRKHVGLEIRTLDDYRRRYAQYKGDAFLQAAHARCPWFVVWDDHEVDNNYASLHGENNMESEEQVHVRRAAGYQAWWEHQPVRVPRAKSWADLNITRAINWGAMARFWMLDTRQYRDDQACNDGNQKTPCGNWNDPARTLMGAQQEKWLVDGIGASKSHWQIIANQVMVAPYDSAAGPDTTVSMDQWSGYPAARDRLLKGVSQRAANRTVVLTGDIHSNWVNELHEDFSRPGRPTIGAEFVTTSITSGGDGSPNLPANAQAALAENTHIKWHNRQRGYVKCAVNADGWNTDYRVVPFVRLPGAGVETASQWRVTHGKPGIQKL